MNTRLLGFALATVWLGVTGMSARADGDHPTVHAAGRYAHRKVVHVNNAASHAHAHYKNWKQRKGHNARVWLNKH